MKHVQLFIAVMCFESFVYGQRTIKGDELLFEKALMLQQLVEDDLDLDKDIGSKDSSKSAYATEIKESILDKSHDVYEEMIDSFPDSKLLFRAFNNKAVIEMQMNDLKEARKSYLFILNSKALDTEPGGVGGGLMGEPYANYKNRAAKRLAIISLKENNYKEALTFLDLTKKYPYKHFCGNEFAADDIYMAEMYAKCYIGLNDYPKAYEVLLPRIFKSGLADNSALVDLTYEALLRNFKKEELQARFKEAIKKYGTEKEVFEKNEYTHYFITFLETKIELISWKLEVLAEDKRNAEVEKMCLNSRFYQLLSK